MATHSSILAWKIPQTEEPGELQSMGQQRVGHNEATNTTTIKRTENSKCWENVETLEPLYTYQWECKVMGWVNLTQMTIISSTAGRNPLEDMEQPSQSIRV